MPDLSTLLTVCIYGRTGMSSIVMMKSCGRQARIAFNLTFSLNLYFLKNKFDMKLLLTSRRFMNDNSCAKNPTVFLLDWK